MDLLTSSPSTDEWQELSARALRACLAAEAALASLRAECLPLQSSLPRMGEIGSRNLELAHRSLQLQIDACESFTLCATAAFKQLCDAHFLASRRKDCNTKLIQNSGTSTMPSFSLSCTQKLGEYGEDKSKESTDNCNSKSGLQIQEEAPTIFCNSLSSLMSSDSEEAPGDSQNQHMGIPASISGSRSCASVKSYDHKSPPKEFPGRFNALNQNISPREFAGRLDISPSKASLTQTSNAPNLFALVKDMTMTPFDTLDSQTCSSSKDIAESLMPAPPTHFSLKNLSPPAFQFSVSEAAPTKKFQSPYGSSTSIKDTTENRELHKGNDTMSPSFSSTTLRCQETTATDHTFLLHRREPGGEAVCNNAPNLAVHPSGLIGHSNTEGSKCCGYAEVPCLSSMTSQSYRFFAGPSPETTQFRHGEPRHPPMGCKTLTNHEISSTSAATDIGKLSLPNLSGCDPKEYSKNSSAPPATSPHQFRECNNDGKFLHLRPKSSTSSDLNFAFLSGVDSLDLNTSQTRSPNASQGNLRDQRRMDSSSPSAAFAAPREGQMHVTPGVSLNLQFTQTAASFVNTNTAAHESANSGLPSSASALRTGYGQSFWDSSAVPQTAAVTYQLWPCSQTIATPPKSVTELSTSAASSFAVPPLTSLTHMNHFVSQSSTRALANDPKNGQVQFHDKSFSAYKPYNRSSKAHLEETGEEDPMKDNEGTSWLDLYSDMNKRVLGTGLLEIDSEDDSDDGD